MSAAAAAPPADVLDPTGFSSLLLNLSVSGVLLMRPRYGADGEIVDFDGVRLNPAAQQMLRLPECPAESFRTLYPTAQSAGVFDFYREAFLSDTVARRQNLYQRDGLDGYYALVAQRYQDLLVVSFTDTNDQPRSAVEDALRESQAREQATRAEAEAERQRFQDVLMQLPAQVAINRGPDHVFTLVNASYKQLFPTRPVQGLPVRQALPELEGQQFFDLLDCVYQTGEPFYSRSMPASVDFTNTGKMEQRYVDVFFQALHDAQGQVDGVLTFSYDVTEQVRARQQVQTLNEELAALNEELRASNEEYQQANVALSQTQQQLEAARAGAEAERQRLYQVLMRMPANIALLRGPEHVYDLVNAEYEQLFPARTTLGRPLREVIPDIEGQGFYELFDRVYETGEPFYEAEAEAWADFAGTGEPQRRYYRTTFEPIRNAQGEVTEVLNFAVDITAQVEARQQVEQLNQELEARVQARTQEALALQADLLAAAQRQVQVRESFYQVFEQTPAAVSLLRGPTYRFEYVNPVYQQVFAGRQLVGRDFADALPDAAAQGYLAMLDGVYHTGETFFGAEVPFVSEQPDAPPYTVYFNFTYQAYREHGEIVGISTFALDVTEQVLARQEREAQQQQLERLFLQAPAAIAILGGPGLVYELVNPVYQRMFPSRELLGHAIADVFPELAGTGVVETFEQVYKTGLANEEESILIPILNLATGQLEDRYFNYIQQARRDARGRLDGVLVFAFEVSEQVRARQQAQALAADLTIANTQLTRTNIDLDNFIYTASHDLKAPITNIEGLLLALEHELPEAARTGDVPLMLTMMQDAVDRFRRTITHLTDLSRLQKEHNPTSDAVALAPVVEAVRLDLTPLLSQTQGELTATIPEGLTVTFAEKNLRSVVYNLLSNAFKYHHPDRVPDVQLRSWLTDDYVVLEVQDNGLGLDLSQGQERLFAMFQRLHTHVEGTGVGLYMVKRTVENAGGRIEVVSQLGQGSTFQVYFSR